MVEGFGVGVEAASLLQEAVKPTQRKGVGGVQQLVGGETGGGQLRNRRRPVDSPLPGQHLLADLGELGAGGGQQPGRSLRGQVEGGGDPVGHGPRPLRLGHLMLVELGQQFGLPAPQPADMGLDPADLRLGEIDPSKSEKPSDSNKTLPLTMQTKYDGRGVTETRSDTKISKKMPEKSVIDRPRSPAASNHRPPHES